MEFFCPSNKSELYRVDVVVVAVVVVVVVVVGGSNSLTQDIPSKNFHKFVTINLLCRGSQKLF